jgi:hypothetical protein
MRDSMPYKQAQKVGIIFSVEDKAKHDQIKEFVKRLEHDGKQVTVISFLPKKKENYEFLFDFFTDKDLTFWGNNTSHTAISFSETAFDYLFYIDNEPNPLIINLLAKSKAKCRVGKYVDDIEPFFELMIESKEGTKGLIDGMYKYTTLLK